jgi:LacI family transcriptional regulator
MDGSRAAVAGRRRVSIKDVARQAGVAVSSVSRVLNDHPNVSAQMRQRVLDAVAALDYERDLLGSSLRRGTTRSVGFLVSDVANTLFADMAKGAESELQQAGYSLVVTNSDGDPARDERSIRLLSNRRVDGLILAVSDETDPQTNRALTQLDNALVLLDRELRGLPRASAVLADHATGMSAAVDHLVGLGHRRIALLGGPLTLRPHRERLDAFKAAHRRRKIAVQPDLVLIGPTVSAEFGRSATARLLALPADVRPTALISGGNLVLIGLLRALHEAGAPVVGQDLSLVSCDDVPLAELHYPPITVVARDTVEMGRVAARLVLERLHGANPRTVTLPTQLVVRSSAVALR